MKEIKGPDVLFVNPCLPTLPREVVSTPFGPGWMSAVLKREGVSVKMLDMQVEPSFEKLSQMLEPSPLVIGVTHFSNFSMGWSGKVVEFIRERLPDTPIIAGGTGSFYEPHRALVTNNVSAIVMGEGENTMLALAQRSIETGGKLGAYDYQSIKGLAFLADGQIQKSLPRPFIEDLNSLPLPDRELFNMKLYPQGAIITSRGCSHLCGYCSSSDYWKNISGRGEYRVRLRSADNVLAEIDQLVHQWGITKFYILDDVFTYDRDRVIDISKGIITQGYKLDWACLARGDQVDPEMLAYMRRAGCSQVHYGIESANNKSLKSMGKGITIEQLSKALRETRDAGLRTRASVIIGLPRETTDDVHKTIQFLLDNRPNEIQIYALMPWPGSRWSDQPDKYGIRILQPDSNQRIQNTMEPFAETDLLPEQQIKKLAMEAVERLKTLGYTFLSGNEGKLKLGQEYTVSTAFTPLQKLEALAQIGGYEDIVEKGPIPYEKTTR